MCSRGLEAQNHPPKVYNMFYCFDYYRAHSVMSQKRLYYYLLKMVIERDHIWQLLMHQYISDRSNQSIDVDLCV